jgi:hypothetical protein
MRLVFEVYPATWHLRAGRFGGNPHVSEGAAMRTAFLFMLLGLAADLPSVACAEERIVSAEELPLPRLFVEDGDQKLLEGAPGVITGPKAWAQLWKSWGAMARPRRWTSTRSWSSWQQVRA